MSALWRYLLSLHLFTVCIHGAYEYPEVELENYCDQTIYLSCPDSSSGRAGKLLFFVVPLENCSGSVQTVGYCIVNHAIYFNIRRSDLAMDDFVEVYENVQYGSNGTLIKRIPGGASFRGYDPSSVAQLLTSYNPQQRLRFHLHLEPKMVTSYAHEVHFDYTIVRQISRSEEGYCRALNGYMPNEIICSDSSSFLWRVNCPVAYSPAIGITNRASGQQTCTLPTTTTRRSITAARRSISRSWTRQRVSSYGYSTPTTSTTTERYEQSAQYGHIDRTFAALKSLGIAGIFLMVVIGVLLVALLVMFIMRLAGKRLLLNAFQGNQTNGTSRRDGHSLLNPRSAL